MVWFSRSNENSKNVTTEATARVTAQSQMEKGPEDALNTLTPPEKLHRDHRHWTLDRCTSGSYPESTQLATTRQLARMVGDTLAKTTDSFQDGWIQILKCLYIHTTAPNTDSLLCRTVDVISSSRDFSSATDNLVRHFDQSQLTHNLDERMRVVTVLAKESCTRMLDGLLSKPKDRLDQFSGDGTIHTTFRPDGKVQQFSLKVTPGAFASTLNGQLFSATADHLHKIEQMEQPTSCGRDDVFKVILHVGSRSMPYLMTGEDLKEAYFKALMLYAAGPYAERVRATISQDTPATTHETPKLPT